MKKVMIAMDVQVNKLWEETSNVLPKKAKEGLRLTPGKLGKNDKT